MSAGLSFTVTNQRSFSPLGTFMASLLHNIAVSVWQTSCSWMTFCPGYRSWGGSGTDCRMRGVEMAFNIPVPPSLDCSPSNPLIYETSQAPEVSLLAMHLLLEDSGTEPRSFVTSWFLEISSVICSAVSPGKLVMWSELGSHTTVTFYLSTISKHALLTINTNGDSNPS